MKYKLSVYFVNNSSVKMLLSDKIKLLDLINKYLDCSDTIKITIKKINANA